MNIQELVNVEVEYKGGRTIISNASESFSHYVKDYNYCELNINVEIDGKQLSLNALMAGKGFKFINTGLLYQVKEYIDDKNKEARDKAIASFTTAATSSIPSDSVISRIRTSGDDEEFKSNEKNKEEDNDTSLQLIDVKFLDNKIFYIPDYQRGYRWTDEVEYFIKDLIECKKLEYLFQPIVVKKIETFNYNQLLNDKGCPQEEVGRYDGESYELIDGQQRLTTLYLVLVAFGEKPKFKIYYQSKREIDNIYINNAKIKLEKTVKLLSPVCDFMNKHFSKARFIWYESENEAKETFKSLNAGKTELTSAELFKALLLNESGSNESRQLIAYQFDEMETQLNNEDLWCFLSDDGTVATRIDFILNIYMYGLNKKLIYHDNGKKIKRTDNISKYMDKAEGLLEKIDSRFAFLAYSNFLEAIGDENLSNFTFYSKYHDYKSNDYWEEIYDCFEIIKSWYSDPILHNLIGYLLAKKGDNFNGKLDIISNLFDKQRDNNYKELVKIIYKTILDGFKFNDSEGFIYEDINYGKSINLKKGLVDKEKKKKHYLFLAPKERDNDADDLSYCGDPRCYNFLLLSNIEKSNKSRIMFDFKHLKSKYNVTKENLIVWDIEHINPKNLKKALLEDENKKFTLGNKDNSNSNVEDVIKASIEFVLENIEDIEQKDKELLQDFKENISVEYPRLKEVQKSWKNVCDKYKTDNSITNLTLLSSDINRSYQDNPFKLKKQQIIDYSDKGYFIPLITRQIFTSTKYSDYVKWDNDAKQKYRDDLIEMLIEIIKKSE